MITSAVLNRLLRYTSTGRGLVAAGTGYKLAAVWRICWTCVLFSHFSLCQVYGASVQLAACPPSSIGQLLHSSQCLDERVVTLFVL